MKWVLRIWRPLFCIGTEAETIMVMTLSVRTIFLSMTEKFIFKQGKDMYVVWTDSESEVEFYKETEFLGDACEIAGEFVHGYDFQPYRVIAHVDDESGETIDTYENINPCDSGFDRMLRQVREEVE